MNEILDAKGSRIPGFYRLPVQARRAVLAAVVDLSADDLAVLESGGLDSTTADQVVENVVGVYALPLGLALNFRVNGRDCIVPMVVEEPSVIAAASNAARLVRQSGGFVAEADPPVMTAQIEICDACDAELARSRILERKDELLSLAAAAIPRLIERGGGPRGLEVRVVADRLIVHVHVDCRDAMGANTVNTVAEALADRLAQLADGRPGLRILTNLADRRCVRVSCRLPAGSLGAPGFSGAEVRDGIVAASRFAEDDTYRAATHNKGIMNGVDAVVIATGNDWRGVEAGAHAFAASSGRYRPLAIWTTENGDLCGRLEMPMAIGTVGGTVQTHAGARLALRILGVHGASELAMIVGCAGLASNLAALRALATDGIQRGHMALHARSRHLTGPNPEVKAAGGTGSPAREVG